MKKILRYLGILVCLSLHAAAWGDMADNGVECSVVMEKTRLDAREAFPDFKLVFTNKGEKTVRLFDDFYPVKEDGPNIIIRVYRKEGEKKKKIAVYYANYKIQRGLATPMNFIILKPGEKHDVPIKDVHLLLVYLPTHMQHAANGKDYMLEVRFYDGYGDPGFWREYVGKQDFSMVDQSPYRGQYPGERR